MARKRTNTVVYRLAGNVRRLRGERTIAHCSVKSGIPLATWYRLERPDGNTAHAHTIDRLAAFFRVDVAELFRGADHA